MDSFRKWFRFFGAFVFAAALLSAAVPACPNIQFKLTAVGATAYADNRQAGCSYFTMAYQSTGFSAISLQFESASGATVPGSFAAYSGTITAGINPNTSTTGAYTTGTGYVGWYRVNLTSATGTGTVTGVLFGTSTSTTAATGTLNTVTGPAWLSWSIMGGTATASQVNAGIPNSALANPNAIVNSVVCTLGINCNVTGSPTGAAGGDLTGTYPNPAIRTLDNVVDNSLTDAGIALNTIANNKLVNKSTTVNGVPCTLGASCSIATGGAPTGAAGGDLGGTYPNPTVTNLSNVSNSSLGTNGIANNAVTNGKLANTSTTVNGVTCTLGSTCTVPGGVAAYPLTFVQDGTCANNTNNPTNYTCTFQQTTAASGNTIFLVVSADGSQAISTPAGWTLDLNKQQNTYARFMLLHKTTASDTSVTFTFTSSNIAIGYFEVTGAHTLDQSSTGGSAVGGYVNLPAITPTANAAVFSLLATAAGGASPATINQQSAANPYWLPYQLSFDFTGATGGRVLYGWRYTLPAPGSASMKPPQLTVPQSGGTLYVGAGMAWATFSIL